MNYRDKLINYLIQNENFNNIYFSKYKNFNYYCRIIFKTKKEIDKFKEMIDLEERFKR